MLKKVVIKNLFRSLKKKKSDFTLVVKNDEDVD